MADENDRHARRFSLQTLLVWISLCSLLLAVLVNRPGYIGDALIFCVGLYVIHQAWHTRFKHWRGAFLVGIVICIIGTASAWWLGWSTQDLIDGNRRLREIRDEMHQHRR